MPDAAVAGVDAGAGKPAAQRGPPPVEEPLPAEVAAQLAEADRALGSGAFGQAEALARASLLRKVSARAHAIIVLAACGRGDLETALAWFRKSGRADRPRLVRECGRRGVDLAGQ